MLSPSAMIGMFFVVAIGFVGAAIAVSMLLAPKRWSRRKLETYECGEQTIGASQVMYDVKFYIFALAFVVFDVEALFLFPWAVIYRSLGLFGLVEMGIFLVILIIGLAYVWRKGALKWV